MIDRIIDTADLTPGERAVADFYERSMPGAAFMNLAQVSQASSVSTATVTRFARKLGFADFRALARAVQAEARAGLERPMHRMEPGGHGSIGHGGSDGGSDSGSDAESAADDELKRRFDTAIGDLSATSATIRREDFAAAAQLLADATRPLYLVAVASGQPLLMSVAMLLRYARGDVTVLDGADCWAHAAAGLDERAVLLATAYDRDSPLLVRLLAYAKRHGATTIVIANRRSSSLFEFADVRLPVITRAGDAAFGSRAAMLVLLEALVDAVVQSAPADSGRAARIEEIFEELGVHPSRA